MARFVTTPEGYSLLHRGMLALAEIEAAGVRVDTEYLDATLAKTAIQIKEIEAELRADPIYKKYWVRRYGEGATLTSPEQLAGVVYGDLGYTAKKQTKSGKRGSSDQSALEGIDLPFVRNYFRAQKIHKARGTYLLGIKREMVEHADGWYVHPSYNLNTVNTYRSSSSEPNWQNVPIRNPEVADMVRRCYVPRPGYQIVEIDYAQAEVRVAACYNRDPNLIAYVTDPTKDMHRDLARKLFFLSAAEIKGNKQVRNAAKGDFVFAEFYGSFYPQCARALWEGAGKLPVSKETGAVSILERLAEKGIHSLGECSLDGHSEPGTFEAHVRAVEEWFWEKQFPVYKRWKRDWFAEYQRCGGFQMLTGFAVSGHYSRNDVVNYPIQGSSFHCLLLALIRIVRRLRKLKMRSRVIGEIHDCLVGDVHPRERDDYIAICREAMIDYVMKKWADWIIVPLETETECCEPDASWLEKKTYVESGGRWILKQ